ncbi:hypothetical protein H7100_03700 [Candidatus Saccharibacteria bacterium]|nr:hypothetical protein [Candidatus Saccharibacteria bacterium]
MNKDELLALRERLLAEITPLVIDNAGDGTDRFSLLMRVIQSGHATNDVYVRAYESAKSIEETPEKLDALMALLDEVEVDLSRAEDGETEAVGDEKATDLHQEPQPEPRQDETQHNGESHEPQEHHEYHDQ